MYFRELSGGWYTIEILFQNGSKDVLENISDYYIDTEDGELTVIGINEDQSSWQDFYDLESIDRVFVNHHRLPRKVGK